MPKQDDFRPHNQTFHSSQKHWAKLKSIAREMRHEPTHAENLLWQRLRNRQLGGLKFRRQYAIGPFVVDFCSVECRLVIEVDGEIHQLRGDEDAVRQAFIEDKGFKVVRFTNEQVIGEIDKVCDVIVGSINSKPDSS